MTRLVYYRQKRFDGGIRAGLEIDGAEVYHHFEPPVGEHDPALLWFVDLRCEGDGVPDGAESAAGWLLEHELVIRQGFEAFAEKLRAGADPDDYPLNWSAFADPPANVTMTIAASAIRRVDAREMASILRDIANRWKELIEEVQVLQEVEDAL